MEYNKEEIREKYQDLFEYSLDLIYVHDLKGNFLDANDVALKLLGYKRDEIPNISFKNLISNDQLVKAFNVLKEFKETGKQPKRSEYEIKTKEGETLNIETYGIPLRKNGKIYAILGIGTNITAQKKAEQELRESEKKIRDAYNRAEFYRDLLAHDINNIFNTIKLSVYLCNVWIDDPTKLGKMKEKINIINQQINRGVSLISNVRKFSEIEESEIIPESVDVKNTLKNAIEHMRAQYQEKEIFIEIESSQEIFTVKGGQFLIDAFENILINGVIHNDSEKIKLWVKMSKIQKEKRRFAKIEFLDNARGINDKRKEVIFNREFKKDRTVYGMGIGLSLVKKIINNYGGQVWVEDRVKGDHTKGSNFIILIPEDD